MAVVQPIKDVTGGTPLDPQQDQIECAGLIVQNSTSSGNGTRIERAPDGQMKFYDSVQMMGVTLSQLLVGEEPPAPPAETLEMFVATVGNGTTKTIYVQHNFQNNRGVAPAGLQVQVWNKLTAAVLTPGRSGDNLQKILEVDGNIVALVFGTAPGVNTIKAVVIG